MLTDGTNFKCKDLKQINFIPDDRKILVNLYQVHAGRARIHFEDMEQVTMDLKSYLIKNDKFTNLFQVVSDSLEPEIRKDDLLIIDQRIAVNNFERQLNDKIIACIFEGESLVKRYRYDGKYGILLSINPKYEPIVIKDFQYFQIWGVTTFMTRESDNFILNNPTSEKLDQIKDIVNNKILSFDNTLDTFYNRCLKPRFYNKLF